jgi:hypothetical protein
MQLKNNEDPEIAELVDRTSHGYKTPTERHGPA